MHCVAEHGNLSFQALRIVQLFVKSALKELQLGVLLRIFLLQCLNTLLQDNYNILAHLRWLLATDHHHTLAFGSLAKALKAAV